MESGGDADRATVWETGDDPWRGYDQPRRLAHAAEPCGGSLDSHSRAGGGKGRDKLAPAGHPGTRWSRKFLAVFPDGTAQPSAACGCISPGADFGEQQMGLLYDL